MPNLLFLSILISYGVRYKTGMKKVTLIVTLFCASFPVSADFKAGGDAYRRGDDETAAKEFLPLAEGKDHRAMYALGSMYAVGHGVPMDLKEALRWFRRQLHMNGQMLSTNSV